MKPESRRRKMKKVMRKLSVLALVCCMVLGLGFMLQACGFPS